MRGRAEAALVAALVLAVLAGPLVLAGAAGAQEATSTSTETPEEPAENSTVVAQVDDRLRVTGYSYNEETETFRVDLENTHDRLSSSVTITEAIDPGASGAGSFGIVRVDVRRGETVTVEVDVSKRGIRGVMITTEESVEQGSGVYLKAREDGGGVLEGDATGADVRSAFVFSASGISLTVLGGAWLFVSRRHNETREVDTKEKRGLLGRFKDR